MLTIGMVSKVKISWPVGYKSPCCHKENQNKCCWPQTTLFAVIVWMHGRGRSSQVFLQATFENWCRFWTPTISVVRKLIILSDNYSYLTLVFKSLVKYYKMQHCSKVIFGFQLVHGWGNSSHKIGYLSYFRSPGIGVRIMDVSDNRSFTLLVEKLHNHSEYMFKCVGATSTSCQQLETVEQQQAEHSCKATVLHGVNVAVPEHQDVMTKRS